MSQMIDEQLSALLDGELPVEQEALLLRRMDREPELRDQFARYGLIGELLRDEASPLVAMSISARVAEAIAAEEEAVNPPVPSLSATGMGYIGAAIAASIALVVMFNLSDLGNATSRPAVNVAALPTHDHADAMAVDPVRLTRYLVSHSHYTNSPSRQLFDSHLAMAVNVETAWDSHE